MGKFRIVYATLSIDYTPTANYKQEVIKNIIETRLETSPFTGKRDCILFAQYDKYTFDLRDLSASDYENVFKKILNKEVTFYPDEDEAENHQMNVIVATPYYLEKTVWKDALILELKPIYYRD